MDKLNLSIDRTKLLYEASDSQLAVVEVWICRSGMNSHKLPISLEAIKEAEQTLINKFLVAGYDGEDFKGHEGLKQSILGFFPKENDIRYVEDDDGETYLVANAILSKVYVPWAYDIFVNDNYREVSMEIMVAETEERDDGYTWITSFIINGVTVLGNSRKASISGSHAVVTEFEDLIQQGEKFYKEFSIKETSNLETENQEKEVTVDMEFNKEEFAKVIGMTASQMYEKLYNACGSKKYSDGEDGYEFSRYYMRDYSAEYIFAYDSMEDKMVALNYEIKDGEIEISFEEPKGCMMTYVVDEDYAVGFGDVIKDVVSNKEEVFEAEKVELTKQIEESKEEFAKLETSKTEIEKELDELKVSFEEVEKEKNDLKEFETNVKETEKKNKIEFAINSVVEDLTKEQIEEWRKKVDEFENVESFENAIQSFAYSVTKKKNKNTKEDFSRIALPTNSDEDKKSQNVWQKLGKK